MDGGNIASFEPVFKKVTLTESWGHAKKYLPDTYLITSFWICFPKIDFLAFLKQQQ